jgi:hypothetical protein
VHSLHWAAHPPHRPALSLFGHFNIIQGVGAGGNAGGRGRREGAQCAIPSVHALSVRSPWGSSLPWPPVTVIISHTMSVCFASIAWHACHGLRLHGARFQNITSRPAARHAPAMPRKLVHLPACNISVTIRVRRSARAASRGLRDFELVRCRELMTTACAPNERAQWSKKA